jgi:hypothetical protein
VGFSVWSVNRGMGTFGMSEVGQHNENVPASSSKQWLKVARALPEGGTLEGDSSLTEAECSLTGLLPTASLVQLLSPCWQSISVECRREGQEEHQQGASKG